MKYRLIYRLYSFLFPHCAYHRSVIATHQAEWYSLFLCDVCASETKFVTTELPYADEIRELEDEC